MKPAPRVSLSIVSIAGLVLFWHLFAGWRTAETAVLLGSDHVDMWGTHWFYWMFEQRLLQGEPFAHTDLLFYPWGKDVYLHTGGNVLDALLAFPFRWSLGDTLGFNVFVLAILTTNGISGGWLVHSMGAGLVASVVVGILAALQPYVLAELAEGRLTQSILNFICNRKAN